MTRPGCTLRCVLEITRLVFYALDLVQGDLIIDLASEFLYGTPFGFTF